MLIGAGQRPAECLEPFAVKDQKPLKRPPAIDVTTMEVRRVLLLGYASIGVRRRDGDRAATYQEVRIPVLNTSLRVRGRANAGEGVPRRRRRWRLPARAMADGVAPA